MAESIAIVLEVEGEVWARSADGDMRLLQAGDAVNLGETVVTAANARVNLEFSSGDTVQLAGGQTLPMSAEMLAEGEPSAEEQAVTDPGVEEVLALLEGDGDLLDNLEDPAAGTAGGDAGGGRTVVQVTRIVEQIDPLAFDFAGPARAPNEPIPGVTGATDEEAEPVEPVTPPEPEGPLPDVSVNLDDQNGETISESLIYGTTTNVEAGQTVFLVVTDGTNSVSTSAIVQPDGSYQVFENLSSLNDGELTVTATVSDQAGNEATDTDTAILDTEAAATITIAPIAGDDTINETEAEGDEDGNITITGSVGGDAGEGDTVTLTVGGETYTGQVDADGNYAIDVPGSQLVANDQVGASVSGSDDAGNDFSASASRPYTVDTEAAASITIAAIAGDDIINETEAEGDEDGNITITGSVGGDAAEGDTVTLTVGGETYTGQVDADGNYAIDVPGSQLVDYDQVGASVSGSDDAGNAFSASTSRPYTVDTAAAATITIDEIAGNDVINAEEAEGDITITGSVGGDASEGDTVTLTVGGETYTGEVDGDNNYAIDVPGSQLVDYDQVGASVTGSDDAGNDFSASTSREYALNTVPVADPVTTTAEVFGEDAVLPDSVSGSPLLFKQFSVDGTVDGNDPEPDPTLGGEDAETAVDELTFTLESLPDNGALFIDVDGDGTYAPAQQGDEFSNDSTFYWLDDGAGSNAVNVDFSQAPAPDSGISLYAYGYDGENDNTLLHYGSDGVGVSDDSADDIQQQVPNQLGYRDGVSQTLVMDFDGPAHDAEISISRLINSEGEVGKVEAYLNGEQVGAWTFSGIDGATLDGEPVDFNIGGSSGSFTLPDGIAFDQLRFTATEYADGSQSGGSSNDSSDYFVDSISYKTFSPAEFTYSVKDADETTSDPVTVEINVPDTDTEVPTSFPGGPSIIVLGPDETTVDEAFLETGTRAGEQPAPGEPGATATGQFTVNAPAGIGVLTIAAAELISGDASFDDSNDVVTLSDSQLQALNDTDVVIETPEGNRLSLTGYNAGTGTVDYHFALSGPVTNVDGQPLDKAPIALELTDANGTSDQATLNVTILDDGIDTTDDLLGATGGGTATGNVLDNDSGADVDLELTSVTFEGTTYPLPENGETINIVGDHGTLTIGRDGNYSYVANAIEPVTIGGDNLTAWEDDTAGLWGFGTGTPIPLDGDGSLLVGDLGDGNGNVAFVKGGKGGLGVDVDKPGTIDDGESLLVQLDAPTDSATVGISQFNAAQAEVGFWNAYAENGELVASDTFNGLNANGEAFDLTIESDESFTYLELGFDTQDVNANQGYVVDEITSTPTRQFEQDAFTYTAVDQDGSTSEGTLSAFAFSDDLNPVIGGEDNDSLVGTDNDDGLVGGPGDDELTGGLGDDVFKWTLADQGDTDDPADDVITDFGEGTNVLDLRDLLVDESEQTISDFLSVSEDGDDLLFQVTSDGSADGVTQTIRLTDMSFSDFGADNASELIQNMLDSGQLDIDT